MNLFSTLWTLLVLTVNVAVSSATEIIVPLYVWPGDSSPSCTAWAPLISVIAAQPSVTFFVIVNPNTGPGDPNTQPDPVYSGCMEQVKAPNVVLVGYVDTQYATRASSEIVQDVATYAGWDSAYAVSGIFFDDVSATETLFSDYSAWASTAKESFNDGNGLVFLNPGTGISDDDYFTIADQILTLEVPYSTFNESDLNFSPTSPASQQSVILYSAPSKVPASTINQLVSTDGIASLYITNLGEPNPYASIPSNFASFVSTVAADS